MQSFSDIWNMVLHEMEQDMSQANIHLWFEEMELISLDDKSAVLQNKSEFKRNILKSRYQSMVAGYFEKVLGFRVEVVFTTQEKSSQIVSQDFLPEQGYSGGGVLVGGFSANAANTVNKFFDGTARNYTFDNFIVGSSNKFAHAACLAVARDAASNYNPLFIHGASGLGKTHLLYAITNEIKRQNPNHKIIYITGETFTNQMIESISQNRTDLFREMYRRADVLLVDDIQFIAGRVATQEEFFHTFNALYESNRQIIMTSDCPPRDIRHLEDRLRTRFEWGLIADIQPPDFELRTAILKSKAQALNIDLPNDVLVFLAENLRNNVRQLEGAVKKIGAQSFLTGVPITMDLCISCTADLLCGSEPVSVTVDRIFEHVQKKYGISADVIKGRKRTKEIATARHVSIYLMRRLTDMSLPAIGRIVNRDHTTVLSSLDATENEMRNNSLFDHEINELIKEIREGVTR